MSENGRILIDDLEGMVIPDPAHPAMPETGEREDWLRRYNVSPTPVEFEDEDPRSFRYARLTIDETAGSILHFWFKYSADRPETLKERMTLWFGGGFELDRIIAHRFSDILARLASGEAQRWAGRSPRDRLAAVIALDQFTRSIFRGSAFAFENDPLALSLAKDAIAGGEDYALKPVERWFLYMPFEHSESAADQRISVQKFDELLDLATPDTREYFESAYDYAKRHASVIRRFGRFPHRNEVLGRDATPAEYAFLKQRPMGF